MTAKTEQQRWRRLSQLFEQMADMPVDAREAFLDSECGGDLPMRAQLERMLALDDAPHVMDEGVGMVLQFEPDETGWIEQAGSERLGHWQLQGMIGTGATGAVFAARRCDDTAQRAAVKRLRQRWDGSPQALRFLQERRILAALSHPNIPRLLDHGLDADSRPWLALELVQGQTITDWADARQLGLPARIELMLAVCAAVQHAHARFVVHRDLKPGNILVSEEGHPMVLDFGVAKRLDLQEAQTGTGLVAGFTPEYAAPEQVSGGSISAATDVYALGVVLYQLLTGRLPYVLNALSLHHMAEAISERVPLRVDHAIVSDGDAARDARLASRSIDLKHFRRYVRGDLARILQTALAKEQERRYPSVEAFARDLRRFLDGRPVSVSGDTFGYRAGKFTRRHRGVVAMAAIAVLAAVTGVIGIVHQSQRAHVQAQRAEAEAVRAEHEARRARAEADSAAASNDFLRSVFALNVPTAANREPTLRQALEKAVAEMDAENVAGPLMKLRFLLAAATSFESFGEEARATALVRQALALQESQLPAARDERARSLLQLAWLRMNYEPEQALRWAQEGFALQQGNDLVSYSAMSEAYSLLAAAYYGMGDMEAALKTTRQGRDYMRGHGQGEDSTDMIASWTDEAVMLTDMKRFDDAMAVHAHAIAGVEARHGVQSTEALLQRLYAGYTLNVASRFAEAVSMLEPVQTDLLARLGGDHPKAQLANMQAGRALMGVGRNADGAALMAQAHDYGRDHDFEGRQGVVAAMLATALARSGQCVQARTVMREMLARGLSVEGSWSTPLKNTRCGQAG